MKYAGMGRNGFWPQANEFLGEMKDILQHKKGGPCKCGPAAIWWAKMSIFGWPRAWVGQKMWPVHHAYGSLMLKKCGPERPKNAVRAPMGQAQNDRKTAGGPKLGQR